MLFSATKHAMRVERTHDSPLCTGCDLQNAHLLHSRRSLSTRFVRFCLLLSMSRLIRVSRLMSSSSLTCSCHELLGAVVGGLVGKSLAMLAEVGSAGMVHPAGDYYTQSCTVCSCMRVSLAYACNRTGCHCTNMPS